MHLEQQAGWLAGWLAGWGYFLQPFRLLKPVGFFPMGFQKVKKVLQNTQETPNGIAKWKNEGAELQSAL